jgi:hypothetical protein
MTTTLDALRATLPRSRRVAMVRRSYYCAD